MKTTSSFPVLNIEGGSNGFPFEIHSMQWIANNRWQQNHHPHKHSYFTIIWVQKGKGTHSIDLEKYEVTDNTVFCISPGQVHLLELDPDHEGVVISFTGDFLCMGEDNRSLIFNTGLFYSFTNNPVIKVDAWSEAELKEVAAKLMKEYGNYFLLRSEILRGYLKIFLIYLTRQFSQPTGETHASKSIELSRRFINSLEQRFVEKKKVSEYADMLNVTANHLNETVKKVTGFPASEHIKQRILLEAKRQATYGDTSMKEVAYSLGFEDMAHFSKFFKNGTGVSFSDFKKMQEKLT